MRPPFLKLVKDIISYFLIFHLIRKIRFAKQRSRIERLLLKVAMEKLGL